MSSSQWFDDEKTKGESMKRLKSFGKWYVLVIGAIALMGVACGGDEDEALR